MSGQASVYTLQCLALENTRTPRAKVFEEWLVSSVPSACVGDKIRRRVRVCECVCV